MGSYIRPRSASPARGYTAVEVMISVAVLAIGASGVMAMQRASIQGNTDARMLDQANSLAHEWVERLRRDAMTWTQPDERTSSGTALIATWDNNTYLISQIGSTSNAGKWIFPSAPSGLGQDGFSPAADIQGHDVVASGGKYPGAVFCTQLKGDWLVQNQLMRVTVRVYWTRQLYSTPVGDFCASDDSTGGPSGSAAASTYHFVYATTAVRRTPGQ